MKQDNKPTIDKVTSDKWIAKLLFWNMMFYLAVPYLFDIPESSNMIYSLIIFIAIVVSLVFNIIALVTLRRNKMKISSCIVRIVVTSLALLMFIFYFMLGMIQAIITNGGVR